METAEEKAAREERESVIAEMEAEEQGTTLPGSEEDDRVQRPDTTHVEQPVTPQVEDPWAGVSPALKQMFTDMEQRVASVSITEQRLKQAESRIGAISNELHAAKEAAKTVQASPTPEQMAAATASDEKWEALKKDFPEWAEAFEGRFTKVMAPSLASIEQLKNDIQALKDHGTEAGKTEADIATEVERRLLTFFKPKWRETVVSKEWQEWLAIQPPATSNLVKSDLASDAVTLISAFEASRQPQKTATEIAEERKRRLQTGDLPEGRKATPVKSEAEMNQFELRASIGRETWAES
jgi:hypothetical protein